MSRRTFRVPEGDVVAILERIRAGAAATITSTGRTTRSYIWRDGQYVLEHVEDGGLADEEIVSEQRLRAAIAKKPELFLPLLKIPLTS